MPILHPEPSELALLLLFGMAILAAIVVLGLLALDALAHRRAARQAAPGDAGQPLPRYRSANPLAPELIAANVAAHRAAAAALTARDITPLPLYGPARHALGGDL